MAKYFNNDFKANVVRLYVEDSRDIKSLAQEFEISETTVRNWIDQWQEFLYPPEMPYVAGHNFVAEAYYSRRKITELEKQNQYLRESYDRMFDETNAYKAKLSSLEAKAKKQSPTGKKTVASILQFGKK